MTTTEEQKEREAFRLWLKSLSDSNLMLASLLDAWLACAEAKRVVQLPSQAFGDGTSKGLLSVFARAWNGCLQSVRKLNPHLEFNEACIDESRQYHGDFSLEDIVKEQTALLAQKDAEIAARDKRVAELESHCRLCDTTNGWSDALAKAQAEVAELKAQLNSAVTVVPPGTIPVPRELLERLAEALKEQFDEVLENKSLILRNADKSDIQEFDSEISSFESDLRAVEELLGRKG